METNMSATDNPYSSRLSSIPNVRISVDNFGPIEKGAVDIRPLTVFVGPSNTGKTYLAILIYAFHRMLHGFPRFPLPNIYRYFRFSDENISVTKEEIQHLYDKIKNDMQSVYFSDIPELMRESAQSFLGDKGFLANDLEVELKRCFDIGSIIDLMHISNHSDGMDFSFSVKEDGRDLWNFRMDTSNSGIASKGNIENMELLSEQSLDSYANYEKIIDQLLYITESGMQENEEGHLGYLLDELSWILFLPVRGQQAETYYLPAARSGIMQSHRVIASSLVTRSTRAGLERFPELPTFSGVMADFMQRLILYDAPGPGLRLPRVRPLRQKSVKAVKHLADTLELQTLGGKIQVRRPSADGYPEFVYRPRETEHDIRLSRASSMVSELAPVVLFLRGSVRAGDTLIIEEPEAHLHPAAQTEMAVALARLVRAGVRVVITTHSDWLLHEIGNLMRAGTLSETTGEPEPGSDGFLRSDEVGVWLFRKKGDAEGSTISEIPFDPVEGVQPDDYEDVAEELYNRSADLQNRLEEAAARGKTKK